ncbi:Mucin-like protein [Exaiptasia diaphana]|nr:Mucin-like protein [Exaiptasia diaphana]
MEQDIETVLVPTHPLLMEERTVPDHTTTHRAVTKCRVHLWMVDLPSGATGRHALSYVAMEQDIETVLAPTHHLLMEELIVLGRTTTHRTVTRSHVPLGLILELIFVAVKRGTFNKQLHWKKIARFKGFELPLNSIILRDYGNDTYLQHLSSFLKPVLQDSSRSRWIRCWRAASDGWDVDSTFHRQCDNKGPTVTIVRVGSYIFGGYSDISWDSSSVWTYSNKAFLFTLNNTYGYYPIKIADTDCHTSELWTMLVNHVMETLTIGDIDSCYRTCAAKPGCQSINYYRDKSLCELNSWTIENTPHMRVANKDSVYFTIPVDGNLTEWGRWSNCSLTCGKGTRYRNRSCTYPPPAYGGKNCTGPYNDTQSCNPQPCFGAIGIQNKTIISDYYLTATRNNGNANKASLNGRSGWWANCEHQRTCNRDWLQINLGKIAKVKFHACAQLNLDPVVTLVKNALRISTAFPLKSA